MRICLAFYILNFSKAKLDVHHQGCNSIADIFGMALVLSVGFHMVDKTGGSL